MYELYTVAGSMIIVLFFINCRHQELVCTYQTFIWMWILWLYVYNLTCNGFRIVGSVVFVQIIFGRMMI